MKNFGIILFLVFLGMNSSIVQACSVCFGDPDSLQTKGIEAGVWFLLGAIGIVLICFAGFFLHLRKRIKNLEQNS